MVACGIPRLQSQSRMNKVPALKDLVFYWSVQQQCLQTVFTLLTYPVCYVAWWEAKWQIWIVCLEKNKLDSFSFPKEYTMLIEAFLNIWMWPRGKSCKWKLQNIISLSFWGVRSGEWYLCYSRILYSSYTYWCMWIFSDQEMILLRNNEEFR